jgi:hypothetical protein
MGKKHLPIKDNPEKMRFVEVFRSLSQQYGRQQVFSDFCAMSAIGISNAFDPLQRRQREEEYMRRVKRYTKKDVEGLSEMLAQVVLGLENKEGDFLGDLFGLLELHNEWTGQFFTPYNVSYMMAKMLPPSQHEIEAHGFETLCEPAIGAGGMVIAYANAMRDEGINYQKHLHVTGADIDITAVHMAYIQLSLLYIPALIFHQNALSFDPPWSCWATPAHVLGGWDRRLRAQMSQQDVTSPVSSSEPDASPVEAIREATIATVTQRIEQLEMAF